MITVRKAGDRGFSKLDWLESYHSFSFADYYDEHNTSFSVLRVINDDTVIPDGGFPTHSHKNMEIITYVLRGSLEHKDSLGNTSVIHPGDTQRMSAGQGVTHSEYNASSTETVHFLQIWVIPNVLGVTPSYEQKHVPQSLKKGQLKLIASSTGSQDVVMLHQDADIYASVLDAGDEVIFGSDQRAVYLHVIRGSLKVNSVDAHEGDGVKVMHENTLRIQCVSDSEFLLFDLP